MTTLKLTKQEMAIAIIKIDEDSDYKSLMRMSEDELTKEYCKITDIKISNLADNIINAVNQKNEEKIMTELKMTEGFVVGARDARLVIGNNRKAKPAVEAVKAVKGVEAVEAVKADKEKGIKAVKAVAEVKAVKAVEAQPAKPAEQEVHLDSTTKEVAQEVRARMADQGFEDKFDGQLVETKDGRFRLTFVAETDKPIRDAFKAVKKADGYNKAGLDAAKEEKKAAAKAKKAEEKAKADAAKEKEKPKETPKSEPEDDNSGDDEDAWPGEDLDE